MRSTLLLSLLAGMVYAQAGQDQDRNSILERQRKDHCLQQCGEQDVDCKAICDKAPHPKPIHMDLMTDCVKHCDVLKGDGSEGNIKSYNTCHDSCIGGYMNLGNSQAAPTTKTWVDLVTPASHVGKAAIETAPASASKNSGHGHSDVKAAASAARNGSTIASMTSAVSAAKSSAKASASASGKSKLVSASNEKQTVSGASRQLVATIGSLTGAFAVAMLLL
ncbi:hypothetical protein FKW77_009072 [Venturia effusa]|uniref:Extracellular membrane protein CFEM domain-containing protein n=1 Tax=Venturia effusa TaxID=50376 RepID=A0A517LBK6_9PEZI|nr:hypothetical protein FKW77_009072 [Venturia effusa]